MTEQLTFTFDAKTAKSFMEYVSQNPAVIEMFNKFTFELINAGHKRIGAKMVAERVRWQSHVRGNDGFKINNNYVAGLARLFEARYPKYAGIFSKRKSRVDAEV